MALWQEFCGGFYQALSPVIGADTAINLYTETREVPGSPKQVTMYGTPGLIGRLTFPTTGMRGQFSQDGQNWAVVGTALYEYYTASWTYVWRGFIPNDGKPVSFASNGAGGDQLGVCGGGQINVLDLTTNVVTTAVLPFSNPVTITFIDGYLLANELNTPIVWFSALEDMLTWDALDFFTRSNTSDNIVAVGVSRDRVWAWGTKTTTLFYDSGDVDTPFLPYPGTTFQVGLASPWLVAGFSDQWFWVGQSAKGQRTVVTASEPNAQPISTPPIALFLGNCTTLDDAWTVLYEQDEHLFFAITCPSSPESVQTYCYDVRESLWHARADWDAVAGDWLKWRVAGSAAIDGLIVVGDADSGTLYELDLETYDNDGDLLVAERTAPYLSAENQAFFVDQCQIGTQAGVGLSSGQGSDPVATLEISRNGARTWVSAGTAPLGMQGQYETRTKWGRLGRFVAGLAVFRVRISDPVKRVIGPGAWLRITPGTGQL